MNSFGKCVASAWRVHPRTQKLGVAGERERVGEGSASVSQFGFDVPCPSLAGRARSWGQVKVRYGGIFIEEPPHVPLAFV